MPSNKIEYTRQYFLINKEKITTRMSEKIICDHCNSFVIRSHMNRHKKTKKCKNALNRLL